MPSRPQTTELGRAVSAHEARHVRQLRKGCGTAFLVHGFKVRHRNADQHSDYDEVYLDWLFWIYLATTELTDRLVSRGSP